MVKDVIDVDRIARTSVSRVLQPIGMDRKSSGTKRLELDQDVSEETGYWANPSAVTAKPPRWILHVDVALDPPAISLAPQPGAGNTGYVNNTQGTCAVAAFRMQPALASSTGEFVFPSNWEWLVQFVFAPPLPGKGSSGQTLKDFDVATSEISYMDTRQQVRLVQVCPIPAMEHAITRAGGVDVAYAAVSASLMEWFSQGRAVAQSYDLSNAEDVARLADDVRNAVDLESQEDDAAPHVVPAPHLIGIPDETYDIVNASLRAGKRNFIFHGPPGTGKTSLAEYVASAIGDPEDEAEESEPYVLLTATASWTSHELIGGYQPTGGGNFEFVPGAMLRNFDKPVVIDELNRSPIDKVIGPLFSVLSGQSTTLPYLVKSGNADDDRKHVRILAKPVVQTKPHEFAPGSRWALICTLNEIDKAQLEQLSFALARRFTWIRVDAPRDLDGFVREFLRSSRLGELDAGDENPTAALWEAVNAIRELGPAPIMDFVNLLVGMQPEVDLSSTAGAERTYFAALGATVMPLLDGILRRQAEACAEDIIARWELKEPFASDLRQRFAGLAV